MKLLEDPTQLVGLNMDSCMEFVFKHNMWWAEIGLYDLFSRKFDDITRIICETI